MKRIGHKLTLEKVYIFILLLVFGGIVLQAPISVGFGTLLPHLSQGIKAWAEVLMTIASVLGLILIYKRRELRLLKDPLIFVPIIYIVLHLLLLPMFWHGKSASVSGLIIDLRYIVFFILSYVALKLNPSYRTIFMKVGIAGALVVLCFALLQVTVLPPDILKYIGYNTHTIVPYLTVDQNQTYIRINSTLRGPNPVGAYALMAVVITFAALLRKSVITRNKKIVMAIIGIGGVVALWVSYSRSALLAAILALLVVLFSASYKRISKQVWLASVGAVVIVLLAVFIVGGPKFISNIALHDNPNGGSATKSDQGHLTSLESGVKLLIHQPLGDGIGSTGSASLSTKSPLIIENQYLFTAHEVGWIGLALFLFVFIMILRKLWQQRKDWLALGVFAAGIGLALIGLLLPVWVDDTISIVWWGLAGIVLGSKHGRD